MSYTNVLWSRHLRCVLTLIFDFKIPDPYLIKPYLSIMIQLLAIHIKPLSIVFLSASPEVLHKTHTLLPTRLLQRKLIS